MVGALGSVCYVSSSSLRISARLSIYLLIGMGFMREQVAKAARLFIVNGTAPE
jgi:hypothetical protein